MNLSQWATKWGIPPQALIELHELFGTNRNHAPVDMSEAAVQQRVRLKASQDGARLFRNNVGTLKDDRGVPVRFGLANESSAINKVLKSSDLIGITPVNINGQKVGIFTAYEVKHGSWTFNGNKHEQAQLNFLKLVSSLGGIGKFVTSVEDICSDS